MKKKNIYSLALPFHFKMVRTVSTLFTTSLSFFLFSFFLFFFQIYIYIYIKCIKGAFFSGVKGKTCLNFQSSCDSLFYLLILFSHVRLILFQMHLDNASGAYFDFGNHTEKVCF